MNTAIPPRIPTPPPVPLSFAHEAAKASWVAFLIFFGLCMFTNKPDNHGNVLVVLFAFFWVVVGFAFGVAALFGIRRYGTKGILVPAIIGIILNGLIILLAASMLVAAFSRAQQRPRAEASAVIIVGGSKRPVGVYCWQPTGCTRGSSQRVFPTPDGNSGVTMRLPLVG
jgi:hypothetical protein